MVDFPFAALFLGPIGAAVLFGWGSVRFLKWKWVLLLAGILAILLPWPILDLMITDGDESICIFLLYGPFVTIAYLGFFGAAALPAQEEVGRVP